MKLHIGKQSIANKNLDLKLAVAILDLEALFKNIPEFFFYLPAKLVYTSSKCLAVNGKLDLKIMNY